MRNLPRCVRPVALQSFGPQNTTHLISFTCRLLNEFSSSLTMYPQPLSWGVFHDPITINLHISIRLRSSHQYTTFSHTYWCVGFDVRSAPPVTLRQHKFPLARLVSQRYFHITHFLPISGLLRILPFGRDLGLHGLTISGAVV